MMDFSGKTIALGITGGIAAYRACDFVRELYRRGARRVVAIMSAEAARFITPLTLQALTRETVYVDSLAISLHEDSMGIPLHISMAQQADALVILPATANVLAKLAHGLADDLVSTTALSFTGKPVIIAPAMNTRMWHHPLTRSNLETLRTLPNIAIVEPFSGALACGETGDGHLADSEMILAALYREIHPKTALLRGKRVVVTAGGTQESLDPVRVLTNRSSGKMGIALADECYAMGAEVTLIASLNALNNLSRPYEMRPVQTAHHMLQALEDRFDSLDVLLMAAAVSDFTITQPALQKIKRPEGQATHLPALALRLSPATDILERLGQRKTRQLMVGFAAETEDLIPNAQAKLRRKKLDAIVLNDISRSDIGFNVDTNEVTMLFQDGASVHLSKASKNSIAREIVSQLYNHCLAPATHQAAKHTPAPVYPQDLKAQLRRAVQQAL